MNPRPGEDLNLILFGNSGDGKSASGNTILGRAAFTSELSFGPVTKEITVKEGAVFGKRISVVDTPGVLHSEGEIRTWCQNLLQTSTPCLFLVVVEIGRFTDEQKKSVETALRVIGDQERNSYLLFTKGDSLGSKSLGNHTSLRMVLLGLCGDGKSATGNTILGTEKFESTVSFNPVTVETSSKSAMVEGQHITVVDTPGLSRRCLSTRQLYEQIMRSVQEAEPGPHAFVIVVRISRISEIQIKLFELVKRLFGRNALNYVVVLFTYGDELRGEPMYNMIQTNQSVKELVSNCGNRYCVFNNVCDNQMGNKEQVRVLLDKIREMVTSNNEEPYTSEIFQRTLSARVKLLIRWWTVRDWFTQCLVCFDANQNHDYSLLRNQERPHAQ